MSEDSKSKIVVEVTADESGLEKGLKSAESAVEGFRTTVNVSMTAISNSFGLLKTAFTILTGKFVEDSIENAAKYENIMNTLGTRLGKSAGDFTNWQRTVGKSLGYSLQDSATFGLQFSAMLINISKNQEDLTNRTTTVLGAIGLVASKTGEPVKDVADKMKFAFEGVSKSAKQLGIDTRASSISQSQAFKSMANGTPYNKLSVDMQKAILYQYVLDTITQKYGKTLSDTTYVRMNAFKASLKDLQLALGQAFLPIVNYILPYLNALVKALSRAMQYVTLFMNVLLGYDPKKNSLQSSTDGANQFADSLGNATDAQNKLNDAKEKGNKKSGIMNFDQVHTLNPKADAKTPTVPDAPAPDLNANGLADSMNNTFDATSKTGLAIQKFAEDVKKFLVPVGKTFMDVYTIVKDYVIVKINELAEWWSKDGKDISNAMSIMWNSFLLPIFKFIVQWVWGDIKGAIDGLLGFFEHLLSFIGDVFAGKWAKAFVDISLGVADGFKAILNFIDLMWLGSGVLEFAKGFTLIKDGIATFFTDFGVNFVNFFKDGVKKAVEGLGWVKDEFIKVFDWLVSHCYNWATDSWKNITDIFIEVKTWFGLNVKTPILTVWNDLLASAKTIFANVWKAIVDALDNPQKWFLDSFVTPIENTVTKLVGKFSTIGKDMWKGLKDAFSTVATWFKTNVVDIIAKSFKTIETGLGGAIINAVKTFWNKVLTPPVNSAINGFNGIIHKVPFMGDVNLPSIPQLYNGGITNGKTIAQIGDNVGGQEVVSPLDKLNSIIANTMLQTMKFSGSGNKGGTGGDIILNIDGRTFARIIQPYSNLETNRVGSNIVMKTV